MEIVLLGGSFLSMPGSSVYSSLLKYLNTTLISVIVERTIQI